QRRAGVENVNPVGAAEIDRSVNQIVVDDGQDRVGRGHQSRSHWVGQSQLHGLSNLFQGLVIDGNENDFIGFAIQESYRRIQGGVIRSGQGGAVAGRERDRNCSGKPTLPPQSDPRIGSAFIHHV